MTAKTEAPLILAVDVGGTTLAAGAVTPAGDVLLEERVPTARDGRGQAVESILWMMGKVRDAAERLGHPITAVGVGENEGSPCIVVYVKRVKNADIAFLKDGWKGFPVVVRRMGSPRLVALFSPDPSSN